MSTDNLADLPAIAGSSEQRLLLSVDAPGISTISGRSLADALKPAWSASYRENGSPKKITKFRPAKNDVFSFFASSLWRETERQCPI